MIAWLPNWTERTMCDLADSREQEDGIVPAFDGFSTHALVS
jgi:hypothetical protein